jgi:ankyrin repeat protein
LTSALLEESKEVYAISLRTIVWPTKPVEAARVVDAISSLLGIFSLINMARQQINQEHLLFLASEGDSTRLKEAIAEMNGSLNDSDLHKLLLEATKNKHTETIDLLLQQCGTTELPEELVASAASTNWTIYELYLSKYPKLYERQWEGGGNVLCASLRSGNFDLLQHLLEFGVDPGSDIEKCPYRIGYFMLPVEWVAYAADATILRLLLRYGAVVKDTYALHLAAAESDKLENLGILIDAGAKVNALMDYDRSECNGSTALHRAAGAGQMRNAEYLLEHGADSSIYDHQGLTAATVARRAGHDRIAHFLEGTL